MRALDEIQKQNALYLTVELLKDAFTSPLKFVWIPFMLFLCIAGSIINVVFNIFASQFMFLPLYMDTIWTITITFLAGPVWGCVTGVLTNLIGHTYSFWGYEGYLFALCNIVTALITWGFCRVFPDKLTYRHPASNPVSFTPAKSRHFDEIMSKVFALTILSFTLCFAMSILGGLITFFIEISRSSIENKPFINPASAPTMFYSDMPFLIREILSRIPINIIDRLISTFAGFGIGYIISKIIYVSFKPNN